MFAKSGVRFKLRFQVNEIPYWASKYRYTDDTVACDVGLSAKRKGFLTREEFLQVYYWKTPRSRSKCEKNPEVLVVECTKQALAVSNDELRIGILILLSRVSWPTASAILHFCHKDRYPILGFRALWSINAERPSVYSFPFWLSYVRYCRCLASEAGVDMRTLDRALWQYSKEKQL